MRRRSPLLSLFLAAALLPLVASCSAMQRARTETAVARVLLSDQQMAQIGEQVHAELQRQGIRYVGSAAVTGYVEDVAGRIFALARRDRSGVDYHVHVIDDPQSVNAFATPGGHIYLYSGLILAADNEAEVAGVLAHETGHVTGRHMERAIVNSYGVQALASLALGENPSLARQLAASAVATGILRAHGRSEELEADRHGARYASLARYDPRAMITFFRKLQAKEPRTPRALAWLRTHPVTGERIARLEDYIADNRLGGGVLGRERHLAVEQRLAAAPGIRPDVKVAGAGVRRPGVAPPSAARERAAQRSGSPIP